MTSDTDLAHAAVAERDGIKYVAAVSMLDEIAAEQQKLIERAKEAYARTPHRHIGLAVERMCEAYFWIHNVEPDESDSR